MCAPSIFVFCKQRNVEMIKNGLVSVVMVNISVLGSGYKYLKRNMKYYGDKTFH